MDTIDISNFRNNLASVMNGVYMTKKKVLVKKSGIPMVWLMPAEKSNNLMDMAGFLTEKEGNKLLKLVKSGRNDGSKNKKYLAKW